jgi:hypothetical protein
MRIGGFVLFGERACFAGTKKMKIRMEEQPSWLQKSQF